MDRELAVGDWVYLKLQSYNQHLVERRNHHKLSPRYYEPYRVIERIGAVAYRLELLAGSQIHLIFHISLLEKKVGEQGIVTEQPPQWELHSEQEPAEVLVIRVLDGKEEFLVRWQGSTQVEATWENKELLQLHHPHFSIP